MAEFDIFNLGVTDVETHEVQSSTGGDMYKPSADQGKDGTYKALIRFVPNVANPRNSLVKKYVHWLTNASGDGKLVDSPSTVGEKCPIADVFFKLRKSDSAVDRKMSDKLKRREQYFALVKVIKDPQNPDFEGQYKIFKFGYKIKEKIDAELKPNFGEPTQVFDLFAGKNFELVITRQGEYNNYDTAKFSSSTSSIDLAGTPAERTKESMAAIKAELDAAPSLEPFQYKVWDAETRDFVNSILRNYLNPGDSMDSLVSQPRDAAPAVKTPEKVAVSAAVESSTGTNVDSSDDLDSFLDDLGV
ncbi:hypothetical protein N8Z10_00355 [bacterium]|nr:hypothetical protein [bacterium]